MQHAKVEMGAEGQAAMADNAQKFSGSDWRRGSKHPGRDRTEMTVDTDEPFVLDQDFEPAWAVLLHFFSTMPAWIAHSGEPSGAGKSRPK